MRLLIHNAIALAVGIGAAAALAPASFHAAFLGFVIGTAGTRLAVGFADPATRPARRGAPTPDAQR